MGFKQGFDDRIWMFLEHPSGSPMEGGWRVMAGAGKARVGDDPGLDLW